MQRYHDYVDLMLGGPRLAALVPNHQALNPQQLAGVPDIQFEVFHDIRANFDCQSLATLPFAPALPQIQATPEFKQKYLLMVVPLLAAHSSVGRRVEFYRLAETVLGPGFIGSNAEMTRLVNAIQGATPQVVQQWLGLAPGVAKYGGIVQSAANYIAANAMNGLIPPPPIGPNALTGAIHGMGMKTACLFFRWMTEPAPDLNLWGAAHRTFIPVDTRILQTCRNAQASLAGATPGLAGYVLNGPITPALFNTVTDFVSVGMGFGPDYLRADYPFWALANSKPKKDPPICYNRINALGAQCPMLRTGRSPDPRCYRCNCLFAAKDNAAGPVPPMYN
jgi:hypothetical protein